MTDRAGATDATPMPPTERERALHAVLLGIVLGLAMALLGRSRSTH